MALKYGEYGSAEMEMEKKRKKKRNKYDPEVLKRRLNGGKNDGY